MFAGVPMSGDHTCAIQRARLQELGLTPRELPALRDVDDIADARAVAALAPQTHFARTLASLRLHEPVAAWRQRLRGVRARARRVRPEAAHPRPDGTAVALAINRWLGPLAAADQAVLERTRGPVLDVGCGPGRHVLALARRGGLALGVDIAPAAVRVARLRGAPAIEASVSDRIPGAGTWGSALQLDGNIGIGGAPEALLTRLRELLRPDGEVLVELAPPGVAVTSECIRLEFAGRHSRPFAWPTSAPQACGRAIPPARPGRRGLVIARTIVGRMAAGSGPGRRRAEPACASTCRRPPGRAPEAGPSAR